MVKFSNCNPNEVPAKIIGIQFSLMSPEEIRKSSVVEITSRDTYSGSIPVNGGLFDARMGVLEPGLICPTDGLNHMQTPGYFGHLELARPIYYVQYLSTIIHLLECVCFQCGKLLISKKRNKHLLNLTPYQRWKAVCGLCENVTRCGAQTEDGCGCLQPIKIKQEGIASLSAVWKIKTQTGTEERVVPLMPEMVLEIFKRIGDDDITFMGFSPIWSRPEWMVCQVLAVPPPAMRPSVMQDSQQRSEDDISHILVNIVKTNKTLLEKIESKADTKVIDDWTTVLQYYVASMVDNSIKNGTPVTQKSGRPFKSIKDRLNGKSGRMRGNLMAKRVDFSARSVITADPNISIRELGVPLKIAKTLTRPVLVTPLNRAFLTKLVQNGPDNWPGAKTIERANGEMITLRYLDRNSIRLEDGDTVHRHMMNGDPIIFNRQPTLHKMSMMCHIAKVMHHGDTFRMNVADTKPYNADFDGDEMNLHMPQDVESDAELLNLAAVPYQIVSPANNAPIIGIYQDSMVGAFQFTREGVWFSQKDAMNLLMNYNRVDPKKINKGAPGKEKVSSFEILSQIFPPMTMKMKNKLYDGETEKMATSNNVVEIVNGEYLRGKMDKGVLGSGTKGILHRICNDFGNMASANFIDDFQNIITRYMEQSAFSVGISDLITDEKTNTEVSRIISSKKSEVQQLIQQLQMGLFENNSGKTNEEEFETRINNILSKAQNDAGRTAIKTLAKDNRFIIMYNAGSKGSEINIQQMTACLGQQNVDGRRIPYGFDGRTLPHYTKYDDSAAARGFVENSYINGLTPQELFFHAMGGRIGLIDTAVKTSTTGYLQRRFVKALENLKVSYDMTVRTSKNTVVQFSYGGDSFDTVKVENQELGIVDMSVQDIYNHFCLMDEKDDAAAVASKATVGKSVNFSMKYLSTVFTRSAYTRLKSQMDAMNTRCKASVELLLKHRGDIVRNVFGGKADKSVRMPVAFSAIILNIAGQEHIGKNSTSDITLLEAYQMMDAAYEKLEQMRFTPPTLLFKIMWEYYLSPKDLVMNKRFNKKALAVLLETLLLTYKRALVAPGEMVGIIAAQSIGEPTTQMTLNTFHFAGVASKSNVTRGVPRIEELMSLTVAIKNPSLTVYLKPEEQTDQDRANSIQYMLEHTSLRNIVKSVQICYDADDLNTLMEEDRELIAQYREFETTFAGLAESAASATGAQVGGAEAGAGAGAGAGSTGRKKSAAAIAAGNNKTQEAEGDSEDSLSELKWIVRFEMDAEAMLEKNITMDDVHFTFTSFREQNQDIGEVIYSDYNSDKLVFRVSFSGIVGAKAKKKPTAPLYVDCVHLCKKFQEMLLDTIVLRGTRNIKKVILRKVKDYLVEKSGTFQKEDIWVLDTIGTNLLEVLGLNYIDAKRTVSNNVMEIYDVLGVEAARRCLLNELSEVLEFDGSYVNLHHMALMCDRMTFKSKLISVFRSGINSDTDVGPIAKASFEETPEMFLRAAQHAELDTMTGVSANVMAGQMGNFGTSAFQLIAAPAMLEVDTKTAGQTRYESTADAIEKGLFEGIEDPADKCSTSALKIHTHVANVKVRDTGKVDMEYDPFL